MIRKHLSAMILSAGLGAIEPLMSKAQKSKVRPTTTINHKKALGKIFYRGSHCRRYVKANNGKPKTGAAAIKRAASKRKTAKAKSSKRR